jgi:hypothetical protein
MSVRDLIIAQVLWKPSRNVRFVINKKIGYSVVTLLETNAHKWFSSIVLISI